MSEYQQRSLEMLESEMPYMNTAYEAEEEIKMDNQIISATEIERLKSHTMVDAAQQEIKNMMNRMKLIEGDIKGATVDKSV